MALLNYYRREFLKRTAVLAAASSYAPDSVAAETVAGAPVKPAAAPTQPPASNRPSMVEADGSLRFEYGEENQIINWGLQPWMVCTASGALIIQSHVPEKPVPTAIADE